MTTSVHTVLGPGVLTALAVVVAVMTAWRRPPPRRAVERRARARTRRRRRTVAVPPAEVAAWCAEIARVLRAGSTLRVAVVDVEPDDAGLRARTDALRAQLERGAELGTALTQWTATDSPAGPHLTLATGVLWACARVGGPAAEPLDRAAATLRARATDEADRAAQSAQARLSARVMTVLPLCALALLSATDGDVRSVLTSPTGMVCVLLGGTLNAVGWWWMHRVIGARRWR